MREAGALTRNAKGYSLFASVARAPLFEVRGVRFTHSPYWYTSVTRASVILFNLCYFNVLFFDLKHNVRDTDVDLSAFKHFSGLK